MLVLVYRKCSTCLKALKWLEEHNVEFEERPIVEQNPSYEELKVWYEKSGLPLKKFFNRYDRRRAVKASCYEWNVSETSVGSRR